MKQINANLHYRQGELSCGAVSLATLAQQYGTPLYVYDLDSITQQYQALDQAIKVKHHIAFAIKANGNLTVLNHLRRLGAWFDIVSGGELLKAQRAGAKPSQIVFSGVGKSPAELRQAIRFERDKIGYIAVESKAELQVIEAIAAELNQTVNLALRINPEIDAKTHAYIATALKTSKFGLDFNHAKELLLHYQGHKHLQITAISFHIGSQITDLAPFEQLLKFATTAYQELKDAGVQLRTIDLGGGLGVRYQDEKPIDFNDYANLINRYFADLPVELILEPGRCLVANAGFLLATQLYSKHNGDAQFRILDCGMHTLMRPALYQAYHEIVPLREVSPTVSPERLNWVGPICESADFIARERLSTPIKDGQQVAILSAGAYGFVMSSQYNAQPRAAEVILHQGKHYLARRRETYEDLLSHEQLVELA